MLSYNAWCKGVLRIKTVQCRGDFWEGFIANKVKHERIWKVVSKTAKVYIYSREIFKKLSPRESKGHLFDKRRLLNCQFGGTFILAPKSTCMTNENMCFTYSYRKIQDTFPCAQHICRFRESPNMDMCQEPVPMDVAFPMDLSYASSVFHEDKPSVALYSVHAIGALCEHVQVSLWYNTSIFYTYWNLTTNY